MADKARARAVAAGSR